MFWVGLPHLDISSASGNVHPDLEMGPTAATPTLIAIAPQWHHSPPANCVQWGGTYITHFMGPPLGAPQCTCLHRYIKMGPINAFNRRKLLEMRGNVRN